MQIESMTKEEIAHLKEVLEIEQRHQDSSLLQIAVKSATSKMIGFVLTGIIAVCAFLYNIGDNQKDMQRIMSTQNERIQNLSSLLTRMQDQISRNTEKISEIWYRGNFNIERHLDMKGGEIETDGPKK